MTDGPSPIQSALGYLQYCRGVETPVACVHEGSVQMRDPRKLDLHELRARDAACECLRAYFNEMQVVYEGVRA